VNHVLMLFSVCIPANVLYFVVLLSVNLSLCSIPLVIYRSIHVKHIYLPISESAIDPRIDG
jgi:hypothetical protein